MGLLRYALVVSVLLHQFKYYEVSELSVFCLPMLHFIQCRIKWNSRVMSDDQSDSHEDDSDEQGNIDERLSLAFPLAISAFEFQTVVTRESYP
jgi:hypothetical protein